MPIGKAFWEDMIGCFCGSVDFQGKCLRKGRKSVSFTTDIKQELCRISDAPETALAECLGMLLFAGQLNRQQLRLQVEMSAVRRRVQQLMRLCFGVCPEEVEHTLYLSEPEELERVFSAYGYENQNMLPLNRAVVEDEPCKNAFLRGAFLTGGYVSASGKGYHLELVTSHYSTSRQVSALLNDLELPAGQTMRRGVYVLYYKDSAAIEDFLSACGATGAAMTLMLKKVERAMNSQVNRAVNCETANVARTVSAFLRQSEAIHRLQSSGKLETLPKSLQETARLRLQYPEYSLQELCDASSEPISKPGMSNRLRRLVQLSEEEQA